MSTKEVQETVDDTTVSNHSAEITDGGIHAWTTVLGAYVNLFPTKKRTAFSFRNPPLSAGLCNLLRSGMFDMHFNLV